MRSHLRAAFLFASACFLSTSALAAYGDSIVDEAHPDKLRIKDAQPGNFEMGEVVADPGDIAIGWQSIYSAYSCVCNHDYDLAHHRLMDALRQGAGGQLLKARSDLSYLSKELSTVAAQRHEAVVTESSCDVQVLQGLLENLGGNAQDAINLLKRVEVNNPTYPSLPYLKTKIRTMEFQTSGDPYLIPPDARRTGGNRNHPYKWMANRLSLKVYIPPDAMAAKIAGYSVGDGQLLRSAFEIWQKQSAGKVRFVYEPVRERADITCGWVSEQKDLHLANAIGVCSTSADFKNDLAHADIKILTFTESRPGPSAANNQIRQRYLEDVCLHEIGHSLGLNHSSAESDIMYFNGHWDPVTRPTAGDVAALNSLYVIKANDFIGTGFDALDSGQYKVAFAAFDKAMIAKPKDDEMRNGICIHLINAASDVLRRENYTAAVDLLTKANEIASGTVPDQTKQLLRKNLHYAFLQTGRLKEARALEKQDTSLQGASADRAAYLDQYGVKRDSIPLYEAALAKAPDDLAIRKKFCFLLVQLARDESNKDNDDEAISLLVRAKSLLRQGMPPDVITKVMNALKLEYLKLERYDEADQIQRDESALIAPPAVAQRDTSEGYIAGLVAAAKRTHPAAWSRPVEEKSNRAKLRVAYEQYVVALRQCASDANVQGANGWAAAFIVRHKNYDGHSTEAALGKMFDLRRRLIALSGEEAVIWLECSIPFKTIEARTSH